MSATKPRPAKAARTPDDLIRTSKENRIVLQEKEMPRVPENRSPRGSDKSADRAAGG